MSEPAVVEKGALLTQISNEIVGAQKQYFGKGPVGAKSYLFDDMLFVVMRGGLTVAEQTMLDFEMPDLVRNFRQSFENKMTERLTSLIEELTGRTVLNSQSQVMFDPDVIIQMFVFDDRVAGAPQAAAADGQMSEAIIGEATDREALDTDANSRQ